MLNNPISLITGVPGAGKSLRAVWHGVEFAKKGRKVFFYNLDGIDIEKINEKFQVEVYKVSDDFTIEKWQELPENSVLIVDEAHNFFPVRTKDKAPDWLNKLTEIRHFGIQLILVTQDSRNLDAFVRRLVGEHEHLTRKAGLAGAMLRTFQQCADNVNDYHLQQTAQSSAWKYPKEFYDMYKSATLHVIKPKVPKKILFAVIALLFLTFLIPFLIWKFKSTTFNSGTSAEQVDEKKSQKNVFDGEKSNLQKSWETVDDYIADVTPLTPVAPWTAPIYKNLEPTGIPELYCFASGYENSKNRNCKCFTEQMTRVRDIPMIVCEQIVKDGFYNPYREKNNNVEFMPPTTENKSESLVSGGGASVSIPSDSK